MKFETIEDIYVANNAIRENLLKTISDLSSEQEKLPSENGKWTLGAIVEHVAKVEDSMIRIINKLLSKAESDGKTSDGTAKISPTFIEGARKAGEENTKFVAPESVSPKGGIAIGETIQILKTNRENLENLKSRLEKFDGSTETFPHPSFGELTAQDWLVLIGGHEARHTAQIKRILSAAGE